MKLKFKERTMKGLTPQDKAIIKTIEGFQKAETIGLGTSMQLKAMVFSLGLDGAREMLSNLKQDKAFYLSSAECDRMTAILNKAALIPEIKAQTVFADAKLKAAGLLNSSMGSSASSVSLGK
jgi:hypothetical protein